MWKLPPSPPKKLSVKKNETTKTDDASEGSDEDEEIEEVGKTEIGEDELAEVKGFPNWRKVDRGDGMPYYFHIETQETSWEYPTKN